MKLKLLILLMFSFALCIHVNAQKSKADSLQVSKTLYDLFNICKTVDFGDSALASSGILNKAATYIIYRGDDKKRSWKDFINYSNASEKIRVDEICMRINRTANQDSTFKIVKYFTETESEGTWHVLMVSYKKKGVEKTTAYAFLKIGKRFGLGDID